MQQIPQHHCGIKRHNLQAQARLQLSSAQAEERSSQQQCRVSSASQVVPIQVLGEEDHHLDIQNELKIPGWSSVTSPGFCKGLGELILPLTIIWTDIKLEYICHCKEFTLLFDRCYLANATPPVSDCLNINWELTGWYKTLQGKIFTHTALDPAKQQRNFTDFKQEYG